MAQKITEALGGVERTGPSRVRLTIIQPVQGSSGNYTTEMLAQAATDKVFPRGTMSMVDHDSLTEAQDRPEGSLRNLAGVTLEDAVWEPDWVNPKTGVVGRLAAEARIGSAWAPFVDEFHEFIGASIYATAEINESGEIARLLPDPFNRVDLVTVAGAAGEISEVIEAARVIESRSIVAKETTDWDVEMWLDAALRDRLNTDEEYNFFGSIDHNNEYVYYRYSDKYYRLPYEITGSQVAFTGDPVEVHKRTEYDPVTPQVSTPEPAGISETHQKEGATMATIDDNELQELQEKARRSDELAAENEQLRQERQQEALEARQNQARGAVREAFGDDAPAFYVQAAETAAASEGYDHEEFSRVVFEAATATGAMTAGTPNLGGGTGETITESQEISDQDLINVLEGRA